jgi:hypothetical protein
LPLLIYLSVCLVVSIVGLIAGLRSYRERGGTYEALVYVSALGLFLIAAGSGSSLYLTQYLDQQRCIRQVEQNNDTRAVLLFIIDGLEESFGSTGPVGDLLFGFNTTVEEKFPERDFDFCEAPFHL